MIEGDVTFFYLVLYQKQGGSVGLGMDGMQSQLEDVGVVEFGWGLSRALPGALRSDFVRR